MKKKKLKFDEPANSDFDTSKAGTLKPGEIGSIPLYKTPNRPPDWTLEFRVGENTEPRRFNFWFLDPSQGDD